MAAVQAGTKVHVVSSMLRDEVRRSGFARFDGLAEVFEAAIARPEEGSSALVLPRAGSI